MAKIFTILFVCISLLGISSCNSDRLKANNFALSNISTYQFANTIIFYDTISKDTTVFIAKEYDKYTYGYHIDYINSVKPSDYFNFRTEKYSNPDRYYTHMNIFLSFANGAIVKKSNGIGPLEIELYKDYKYVTYWKRIK